MLRIIQNNSAGGAKSYYTTADYYTEGQELEGVWRGEGASRLGLSGAVDKPSWEALCDNLHPGTGEKLTLRTKDERRVGYDFNFHVPKSVSLLYSISKDERLIDAFRDSVGETMREMEAEMKTRVRKRGMNEDRTTGNMVWGEFVHFTSRPVDGVPDPHLHAHCFVFNTTWDKKEAAWKAGQFIDLKRDAPYFEAVFHSKFASRLGELGLEIERKKQGWELAGIDKATVAKFSRRTSEIEEEARRKGIQDPEAKSELGAKTRARKQKDLTLGELQSLWAGKLDHKERAAFDTLAERIGGEEISLGDQDGARNAVANAVEHCFERKSVLPERMLLAESLKRSVGQASRESVESEFKKQDFITADRNGRRMVTTRAVLAEERSMISFARDGRGTQNCLGKGTHRFRREWLNDDQRAAVNHVLESRDRVILIRGAAGVGKTSMMQEAVEGIEAGGSEVFTFAPSADASRGTLRSEGFRNTDTVTRLLIDKDLQERVSGKVIWIDEAGLLGTVTTSRLFQLADRLDARVILSGDRKQHGSVERGAALRLLEEEAGLVPAEIREIQRQKGDYKRAVKELSEGNIEAGFSQLDKLGWVREAPYEERYKLLADEYIDTIQAGKTALVVSPTHMEGDRITAEIRLQLQQIGIVAREERKIRTLETLNLTQAERADAVNYLPDYVIEFHQNAKGYDKGQRLSGSAPSLPLEHAGKFQTYHASELALATGDLIRITKNGKTSDGKHRLNNGSQYRVRGFESDGNIRLDNGWTVARDFGHIAHGYVVTSHASQGKTVDRVFVGQSSDSFGASSREQFYVSASRAHEQVTIYTDDKESLLSAINRSDERLTASELVSPARHRADTVRRQAMMENHSLTRNNVTEKQTEKELVYD